MSVVSFTFAPLHRGSAPICTFALPFICLSLINRASVAYFLGDGNIPPLGNVTILNSPPDAATQRL